jgi:CubicO group peptidase (beta-lactamase class C family)
VNPHSTGSGKRFVLFLLGFLSVLGILLGVGVVQREFLQGWMLFPSAQGAGMDPAKLYRAMLRARSIDGLQCLLVSRRGTLVVEQHFVPRSARQLRDVRSVTKSVLSLLVGIALDKGVLQNLDQPISTFVSIPNDKMSCGNITIRHLLTMSSGFPWDPTFNSADMPEWLEAPDQVAYLLERPMIHAPGEKFQYHDAAVHLLSVILTKASGMSTQRFMQEYLLSALGIGERRWLTDHQGYANGAIGLFLTPQDMLRLGELMLHKGVYQGRQIVSPHWIQEATHPQIATGKRGQLGTDYGFLWWLGQLPQGRVFFAYGGGGQFIFVVPEQELVIVSQGEWLSLQSEADSEERKVSLVQLFTDGILASLR